MFWRCANDPMGYCSGEPEWADKPAAQKTNQDGASFETGAVVEGRCGLRPESCGRYSNVIAPVVLPEKIKKAKPKLSTL